MKVLFTIIQADLTKVCHTSAWTGCQQVAFFAMSIERNYKVIYVRNCVRYIQPLIVKLLLYHFSHCLKIINEMLDFLGRDIDKSSNINVSKNKIINDKKFVLAMCFC